MTRPGRATFTRESAERIARAVRQVELATPAARPLSFEAVLSQSGGRASPDVRVAERSTTVVPPSTMPQLDYSAWLTGATKKLVISGEFWPDPALAFAGSGSVGSASYTNTANYPAIQGQPCSFTITVTDNRIADPQAVPPQQAVQYSIPASIPGIGQNNEGFLPIATVSGAQNWEVESGTFTASLMPGQSVTVTATGSCLQSGLGRHIEAENVGAKVESFEVEPGPQYMVVRRDKNASPRWMAVALAPQQTVYGRIFGRVAKGSQASVRVRMRTSYTGGVAQYVLDSATAWNPFGAIGTPLTDEQIQQADSTAASLGSPGNRALGLYINLPGTKVAMARTSVASAYDWVIVAAECA